MLGRTGEITRVNWSPDAEDPAGQTGPTAPAKRDG